MWDAAVAGERDRREGGSGEIGAVEREAVERGRRAERGTGEREARP